MKALLLISTMLFTSCFGSKAEEPKKITTMLNDGFSYRCNSYQVAPCGVQLRDCIVNINGFDRRVSEILCANNVIIGIY